MGKHKLRKRKMDKRKLAPLLIALIATGAMAPSEPPTLNGCSPGFWKNHTELWVGLACTGADCDDLLADLKARGPGSEAIRSAAQSYLNAWADAYYGIQFCSS
jgi:hypothetical protein